MLKTTAWGEAAKWKRRDWGIMGKKAAVEVLE